MELLVYSAAWCHDCREAKRFLDKHSIPYKEVNIETTRVLPRKLSSRLANAPSRNSS